MEMYENFCTRNLICKYFLFCVEQGGGGVCIYRLEQKYQDTKIGKKKFLVRNGRQKKRKIQ